MRGRRQPILRAWLVATVAAALVPPASAADQPPVRETSPRGVAELAADLGPLLDHLAGARDAFSITGRLSLTRDGAPTTAMLRFDRHDAASFDLAVEYGPDSVVLRRRATATALALPRHRIFHVGVGATDPVDNLDPVGIHARLLAGATRAAPAAALLSQPPPPAVAGLLTGLLGVAHDAEHGRWRWRDGWVTCEDAGRRVRASVAGATVELTLGEPGPCLAVDDFPGFEKSAVPRDEIERTLCRGARRALEILLPGPDLTAPAQEARRVPHGSLEWVDGLRVVKLGGTPEQIGRAHGELLAAEAGRCVDSVLHVVGTVETIRGGTWFRRRLDDAAARLAPHVPERHLLETNALATALGLPPGLLASVNVFPELFHCSGFAVGGSATADGTLYHGRVLDYMTEIGLQDAATVFVIAAEGQIPFVTIGYAGFTGSVSCMNERGLSLGEMGGRGEGRWDGVPMATLMRRAAEECTSLDEVIDLWTRSPRTCEYYYVFADGKTRRSVGVAATPERIEFVKPGEGHERLGPGIPDAVVLSAGDRLACLRARITERFGTIDERDALGLMDRPVAMTSNLHNVLFVPERLVLHVAHASHDKPAADCAPVRLDLAALLADMPGEAARGEAAAAVPGARFPAADTLATGVEARDDARACLAGLCWQPGPFEVTLDEPAHHGDLLVRFPSPVPAGPACNHAVSMEWYQARDADGAVTRGPACVVVHESGSGMTVGRLMARSLCLHGIHAFMVHMPFYGPRRPEGGAGPERLVAAVRQAVADVRRARDAAAVLPLVDPARISIQGTSLGGFVTATVAGLDSAYDRVFILLAGGDLAGVLRAGRNDAERARRKLAAAGMTDAEVRETLHAIEPTRLAHRYRPERTWIYSGRYDDVVPLSHARLLADAAGLAADHHVVMEANHYSGIVYLPMVVGRIAGAIHGDAVAGPGRAASR